MSLTKICGVTTPEAMQAAIEGGAAFVGLVAYPKSPRFVSTMRMEVLLEESGLALDGPRPVRLVAVTVNPDDSLLKAIGEHIRPDYIQLHGGETLERIAQVRDITGAGVIKAVPVETAADLDGVGAWEEAADLLLFDARTPPGSYIPGGLGARFDWSLLAGLKLNKPWFLAGGLTPDNVGQAIVQTGAPMVDVSSGVESAPGVKDVGLIRTFLDNVNSVSPRQ